MMTEPSFLGELFLLIRASGKHKARQTGCTAPSDGFHPKLLVMTHLKLQTDNINSKEHNISVILLVILKGNKLVLTFVLDFHGH